MRISNGLTLTLVAFVLLLRPVPAAAQADRCATKPKSIAKALTGKDAYALAKAEATKSDADSALLSMLTPMAGPLDAQGRSSDWMLQFFSPGAKTLHIVYLASGAMTCTTNTVDGPFLGQPIEETEDTIFDTARLVGIAREAGGSALDPKTVTITASFMRSGADAPAAWSINYITPQGRPVLQVSIDGKSGAVLDKTPR